MLLLQPWSGDSAKSPGQPTTSCAARLWQSGNATAMRMRSTVNPW